jgi:hypothetical protein
MDIKNKFLQLTNRTFPHGTEKDVFPLLCEGLKEDEFGNLFIKIGESDVMFTSHLDTATASLTKIVHVFDDNIIKTDGNTILGADDKAGVTIMLYMIEKNIPGLYYFFLGEEVGCVGSKKLASSHKENKIEGINKVVSFDRRGTDSIITYQSSKRCCSDSFGDALAAEFNRVDSTFKYKRDETGVLTDSVQFISIYPECTNISVGYYSEHTFNERQDIEHLEKLAKACTKIDWIGLPVERDASKTEYKSYGGYGGYDGYDGYDGYGIGYGGRHGWEDYDDYPRYSSARSANITKPKTDKTWFYDNRFNFVSSVEFEVFSKKYLAVDISPDRKLLEKTLIDKLLNSLDLSHEKTSWDGLNLTVYYSGDRQTSATRNDLIEYLPELDYRIIDELFNNKEYEKYFEDFN